MEEKNEVLVHTEHQSPKTLDPKLSTMQLKVSFIRPSLSTPTSFKFPAHSWWADIPLKI